jgi:acetate kinase
VRILVLNTGSSSLRFRVTEASTTGAGSIDPRPLVGGRIAGIGGMAVATMLHGAGQPVPLERKIRDHTGAVQWMFDLLGKHGAGRVDAVGHRVVHGGDLHTSVRIDATVLAQLEAVSELAPLHNPVSLAGIRASLTTLGASVPMVAVFDTAFHATLPPHAATYAIPSELATRHRIRRYGFHGIAHASLAEGYAGYTGFSLIGRRLITVQLGNGCSIAAIRDGRSVDTSMGFTPLEGLVMGTRSGDLDPAIMAYLVKREGVPADEVERWLNERSGLLGLSGLSRDMSVLLQAEAKDHAGARFAIEVFCYRTRKYIGAYLAALGGADAVIFGGGIGEGVPEVRARVCEGMQWCGLMLDPRRNSAAVALEPGRGVAISPDGTPLPAYVVAVDEETFIARETAKVLMNTK